MEHEAIPSWRIAIDEWNFALELPLWIRAAERINVPAGGMIPGPLDMDPLPVASEGERTGLAEGWHAWWHDVIDASRATIPSADYRHVRVHGPSALSYAPPDFTGLAGWPDLAEIVRTRWADAERWNHRRKRRGVAELVPSRTNGDIVADVEAELGHQAAPFDIEFVLLPVRDEQIRRVRDLRFLVPEMVYTGPLWPQWLRGLVRSVA